MKELTSANRARVVADSAHVTIVVVTCQSELARVAARGARATRALTHFAAVLVDVKTEFAILQRAVAQTRTLAAQTCRHTLVHRLEVVVVSIATAEHEALALVCFDVEEVTLKRSSEKYMRTVQT